MSATGETKYSFRSLAKECRLGTFSCGVTEIDKWARKDAWRDHCALRSRVNTVHDDSDGALVGLYSFCISLESERNLGRRDHFKRHPVGSYFPALQLQWIAVQVERQRTGIGGIIMGRIIGIFRDAAISLGVPAMILVALNESAAKLYRRMGFEPYGGFGSSRMLLPAQSAMDLPPAT